jgi:hypothetical protein
VFALVDSGNDEITDTREKPELEKKRFELNGEERGVRGER